MDKSKTKLKKDMENIGQRLKAERKKANISVTDFAERYGCSKQNICNIEINPQPSLYVVERYLKVLGMRYEIEFLPETLTPLVIWTEGTAHTLSFWVMYIETKEKHEITRSEFQKFKDEGVKVSI